jgi:hypothetical protein
VRRIVRQYLAGQEAELRRQRALQAIDNLAWIRARIQEQHGIIGQDLLAETRTERDGETACRG